MSEIKNLHEQIENIQKMLIKKRLEHLVSIKGNDGPINMDDVRMFDRDDFSILMKTALREGLTEGSGYIQYRQQLDYDLFTDNVIMKIDGQVYEFTLESSNMFYARALTDKPDRDTEELVDIDLDKLLQIDSQTLQDTPISQLIEELKEKRKDFMTLKLSRAIKDIEDGIEPSSDTELAIHDEGRVLWFEMLRKSGLKEGTDYIQKHHITKWELMTDTNPSTIYIRVGDNIIKYDEASERFSKETSIQDLEEYFKDEDIDRVIEEEKANAKSLKVIRNFREEPDKEQLIALPPIELERLGIVYEKDVAMDNNDSPKTYTEEELNDKYSEYVQIGEEYSYEFNRLLNVAKNLISLKQEIISGKVENREFGDPLTVDYEFIDDLVEILDENGLSCYGRYEWEDNDLYVGEVNTVTTLSFDGYEFTFNEGDGSISQPHVEKEEYGPSVPVFEFDKVIEIIDAKIEEFMKNRYSLLEQNEASTDAKSMADLTVEELQGIINENDSTINGNDESIKQALIARILEQQKIIEEQQTEIDRLKGQKEL